MADDTYPPRPCLVIPADRTKPVVLVREQSCALKDLQALVGGPIQLLPLHPAARSTVEKECGCKLGERAALYVHEEGRLLGLPFNLRANSFYQDTMGVCGDAFVMDVP